MNETAPIKNISAFKYKTLKASKTPPTLQNLQARSLSCGFENFHLTPVSVTLYSGVYSVCGLPIKNG
jgi:hypothetical protein